MTIDGAENPYSCSDPQAALNNVLTDASSPQQTLYKNGSALQVERRTIPQSQSTTSLDTNFDHWDNVAATVNSAIDDADVAEESSDNIDGYCNAADNDGCIPYDYESEIEECSQYTFSAGPYSPSATAALVAAAAPSSTTEACVVRPDTPRDATVGPLPCTAPSPRPSLAMPQDPLSPRWNERQRRDNEAHHAGQHYAWQQAMKHSASSSPDQMRYALRSFVREACCRELQALRSQPAVSFVRMDPPLSESRTHSSMRASCMLASATSTAQRKARYIQVITEHWKALEERVEEMLAETEHESVATSETHLRSIGYALNALFLFSNDPAHIIRELNMAHVEEQRRQRHDREAQLLATLETQGRLFMLPTLYAEEVEEPVPVIRIEESLRPADRGGEFTHPWQLLSPNASLYSLASNSTSSTAPSSAPGSVGELSPSLSCCTIPSEACTPTWQAAAQSSSSSSSLPPSPPWAGGHTPSWKDMQPPRLPMLDLFMTAPAVVPSTVIADSETGVPYVMPVDPSYTLHEMHRQEALARTTLSDALSSPQLSSAHVARGPGAFLRSATDGRLQSLVLDAAEDSWGSFAEEDMTEYADTMKLTEVDFPLFNFDLRETLTGGSSTAATTRATLTDG